MAGCLQNPDMNKWNLKYHEQKYTRQISGHSAVFNVTNEIKSKYSTVILMMNNILVSSKNTENGTHHQANCPFLRY